MLPSSALQPGELFAARYRVVRCLKQGGMGSVFQVIDERTDRLRALKVMQSQIATDPEMRLRFEKEASIVGRVRSDHLVEVVDAGVSEPDTPFLVMELLLGEDLAAHIESCGPLATETVVTLLRQVASGLDKVHTEGVVHRDLKPENLFLTRRDDGSEQVKILDFGVAKLLDRSGDLHTTRSLGTPLYMAPEQMTGEGSLGLHADLYALAHVAFTLLVGSPYWNVEARAAANGYAFMNLVLKGAVEAASVRAARYGAQLPAAFDAWFARATAISPTQRFGSAGEQMVALSEGLAVPQAATIAVRPRLPAPAVVPAGAAVAAVNSIEVASADTVASFSSPTFASSPTTPIEVRPTTVTPARSTEKPSRLRWVAIAGGLATVGLVLALAIPSTRPNAGSAASSATVAAAPTASGAATVTPPSSSSAASASASSAASGAATVTPPSSATALSTASATTARTPVATPAVAASAAATSAVTSTSTDRPVHKGDPLDAY